MRETVGATSLFKYVLAFTFLFAGFLAVAIKYNKVFKLKNETTSIIEKYEGVNSTSIGIINNYLSNNGYSTKGNCETNEYGVNDLSSSNLKKVSNTNEEFYYCLKSFCDKKSNRCNMNDYDQVFYSVKLFFKFDLPLIGELTNFKIIGDTKSIKLYSENQILK